MPCRTRSSPRCATFSRVTSRLALGAVQFGMQYGIANRAGRVSLEEAAAIVRAARSAGIDTLDTAIAYGDSEERLGRIGVRDMSVVTKLPPLPPLPGDARGVRAWVLDAARGSVSRLGIDRLGGLLLHRSADLVDAGAPLYDALRAARDAGFTDRIGVSIYDPAELETVSSWTLDLVQAPVNVLDRRLPQSGWLDRLADRGVEVHARSVFLQGLLLMSADARPPAFARWDALWRRWDGWLATAGHTALEASLGFVLQMPGIHRVVVGADTAEQLCQIVAVSRAEVAAVPPDLASADLELISPNRWSKS